MNLRRLLYYLSVSVGMAMSSSCFFVAATLSHEVRQFWIVAALAVGMLLCLNAAHSIGTMARRFPGATGIRTYLRRGLGETPSIFAVYLLFALIACFMALECQVLGDALSRYVGVDISGSVFLIVIPVAMAINLFGLSLPRIAQVVTTLLLIGGIVVIAVAALAASPQAAAASSADFPGFDHALAGVGLSIFLFMGFEWVVPTALGKEDYDGRIQRSMVAAIVTLAVMYTLFSFAYDAASSASGTPPQFELANLAFGRFGNETALVLTILATATTLNAGFIGTTRLVYGLAREGVLPARLSRISLSTMVPYAAVIAVGVWSMFGSALLLVGTLKETIAVVCAFLYACLYAMFIVCELRLRRLNGVPAGAAYQASKYATALLFLIFGIGALSAGSFLLHMSFIAAVFLACALCTRYAERNLAKRAVVLQRG